MNEYYHKFYSQYLQRDFEMLVFGHSGYPLILFPQAGGRYFALKDSGVIDGLHAQLESGRIKVYCPDTLDYENWYNYKIEPASRVSNYLLYQQTLLKDVIDFARYELDSSRVGLAGFEFGAYHAANLTFRYPDIVSTLYGLGGTFDIKKHIMGFYNDDCYFNNPPDYLPGLDDKLYLKHLKKIDIKICVCAQDSNFEENVYLSEIMERKGIDHLFDNIHDRGGDFNIYKSKLLSYLR